MKIQLDTIEKTIAIEESINLSELFKTLENLLPNDLWKEFTLKEFIINNYWQNPIIVNPIQPYTDPYNPNYPWITDRTTTVTINEGMYNIEANYYGG